MQVHVLQHVPFEGLGCMAPWLRARNSEVTYTRFYEAPRLPSPHSFDLVIAMGGPMSVNDESTLPWLVTEKQFLRDVIDHGTPVLGVCLGSQLIASALGARVYPMPHREIGWFDIESTPASSGLRFPERASAFHWHGETFDLPAGAVRLARSAACENQAFQVGQTVIGLQCHLEVTPACVDAMIIHGRHELVEDAFVQPENAILNARPADYDRIHRLMDQVLEHLVQPKSGG